MNRKLLIIGMFIFFMGMSYVSPAGAKMIKEVAIGVFSDAPSQIETDRFYMRYHGPEITRLSGPWMTNYQLWLPYEPPKEAVELFGAVRGRYAELWFREEDYLDRPAGGGYITLSTWRDPSKSRQANVIVTAVPTETFYDSNPNPEEGMILRWVTFIRYPEGVSVEDGEKWFLNVYAKEALKQPGLLKFVSYKTVSLGNPEASGGKTAPPEGKTAPPDGKTAQSGGKGAEMKSWVRMCEYWYKDFDSWRKAVLESPPKYTAPTWGGKYPFVEMESTFVPYMPDVDFLKGGYIIP